MNYRMLLRGGLFAFSHMQYMDIIQNIDLRAYRDTIDPQIFWIPQREPVDIIWGVGH